MCINNCHTAGVAVADGVNVEFTQKTVFTVEDVMHMLDPNGEASNGNGAGDDAPTPSPTPSPTPAGVATKILSGRYKSAGATDAAGVEVILELRVDVDGIRPCGKVSGDFFMQSPALSEGGGALCHWGSFLVASPQIEVGQDEVTIKGTAAYGTNSKAPFVTVTMPRLSESEPESALRATVVFSDAAGAVEDTFECGLDSRYFRTAMCEMDRLEGTQFVEPYDVPPPPAGGSPRTLTVAKAYEEAGIEMLPSFGSNVITEEVDNPFGGFDRKWSDSELHSAMLTHFSLLDQEAQEDGAREAQWKLWLLVATEHQTSSMRGIMFDHWWNRQRQGCAVFYNVINRDNPADPDPDGRKRRRGSLRTYVHEIGHCFNLVHSWEKSAARPPMPNRPNSLSYMNYVDSFPGGANAFWEKFGFEFDSPELVHLRHAFREDVIMGGTAFGTDAAEIDPEVLTRPVNESGLRLRLEARKSFVLCEPVVVELRLSRNGTRPKEVYQDIHPDSGFVQLAIRKPDGRVVSYRPLATRCVEPERVELNAECPAVYASAYIGYGRNGFYFDQPGFYQIAAVYYSPSGSEVVSPPLTVRVRNPMNKEEEEIADLYYGHDQGALFYLLGSDSEQLSSGNKSLDNVLDKYPDHPLAIHARLVKGVNEGRRFKSITKRNNLVARDPRAKNSKKLLSNVVNSAMKSEGFFQKFRNMFGDGPAPADSVRLDNITLNMSAHNLARAKRRLGDEKGARATLDNAREYFRRARLKKHVLRIIDEQADRTMKEEY